MIDASKTVLVCPRNDEEALQILKIAKKAGIKTVVSNQPHGAKLDREPNLIYRIKAENPEANHLFIVELPGVSTEEELRDIGYQISIIDHHQYEGLDRSNEKSSLEQFLEKFEISEAELRDLGFDIEMIKAVGVMDSEFIWGLREHGYTQDKIDEVLKYWRSMTLELGDERRQKEEAEALSVWARRREQDGIVIVESEIDDISIRDALSFLVEETYHEPRTVFIKQGDRRVYLQDVDSTIAKRLHDTFGGFMFGKNKCWGILSEDGETLPTFEEIYKIIVT